MFKKLVVASAVLAVTSTVALANGAPYVGASVGVANNSASSGNYRGATMQVFGGYGATIEQSFYLGGELFANILTATMNNNPNVASKSLRTTYGYGASIIPGVMISNHTLGFARLGVLNTRFSNLNKNSTGGELGLGLQTSITQNWDVRGEYDYVSYRRVAGVSPNSDQFNLGFVYKFE